MDDLVREYFDAKDLETITGIAESTWYYFAGTDQGPPSYKIGRHRVWPITAFRAWEAAQRATGGE